MSGASMRERVAGPAGGHVAGEAGARGGHVRRVVAGVAAAVVVLVVVVAVLTPEFLTVANAKGVLRNAALVGIVAVAMTPMTMSGNFLSLGTQQSAMAGSVVFIALVATGMNELLAVAVVVAMLVVINVAQGLVVAIGFNPVITTLAAGAIVFGVVATATGGAVVTVESGVLSWGSTSVAGIPLEVFVFVVWTALLALVVHRTVIGRQITLVGASRRTAQLSGISFQRTTIVVFVLFALGTAVASILYAGRFNQATVASFDTFTMDVVAAVLVGGTAIQGGSGSPLRSAAGAVFIAVVGNVMLLNDLSTGARQMIVGGVVVCVVLTLHLLHRLEASR